jgi:hypothetical protein
MMANRWSPKMHVASSLSPANGFAAGSSEAAAVLAAPLPGVFVAADVDPPKIMKGFRGVLGGALGEKSEDASTAVFGRGFGFDSDCKSERLGHTQ